MSISAETAHTTNPRRILLVRLDRIGDLVLTLPVDASLPDTDVHWWIPQGLAFVTQSAQPRRNAREVPRRLGFRDFFHFFNELRSLKLDAAIVFHAPWWVGCLLWLARIPLRAGVKSQWHSFLFFNRAIRQKRSRAEQSELEYNFQLLEAALGRPLRSLPRFHLKLTGLSDVERDQLLRTWNLIPLKYSVVHPGMGGSALNWPTTHYHAFISELAAKETVVITGTPADASYLAPLKATLGSHPRVRWLDGQLNGFELITLLASARTITAPSTGVLHLAASTGRPTLGIFSPVRVQQPQRWGPQGPKTTVVMPGGSCPGEQACLGSTCQRFPCMNEVQPDEALAAIEAIATTNGR